MSNITTFETSKRLKEAGFPHPEYIEIGFVYSEEGYLLYVRECSFSGDAIGETSGLVFAPMATDILVKLGYMWGISIVENGLFYCAKSAYKIEETKRGFVNQNPAEAAALAWLEINEKKWYDRFEIKSNDVLPGSHVK